MKLDFSKFNKKKKSNNNKTKKYSSDIIEKNIICIIEQDIITNTFFIRHNGIIYNIHPDSYNSKGRKIIYSIKRDERNKRIKIIRDIDRKYNVDKRFYIPFAKGLKVYGSLIKTNNSILFKINYNRKFILNNESDQIYEYYKEYL